MSERVASYTDSRPAVITISGSEAGTERCQAITDAAGARILGDVMVGRSRARLENVAVLDAVLADLSTVGASHLDAVLGDISILAQEHDCSIISLVTFDAIDIVDAALGEHKLEILCNAGMAESIAALAAAIVPQALAVAEGVEQEATRLRRLSEEVGRIARTLAEISDTRQDGRSRGDGDLDGTSYAGRENARAPMASAEDIRATIRLRRLRDRFFPSALFLPIRHGTCCLT